MIYQVVMSVYFSVNIESVMSSVATLPNSPILINGVPLSSLVLAVSMPVLTIPLTQPSTPPPLPPQAPPPPPFNPIGLVIGVIGGLCGILICWCT
jgi:H+/Cl- antiporter ClcA